jgi:hypothetical protein
MSEVFRNFAKAALAAPAAPGDSFVFVEDLGAFPGVGPGEFFRAVLDDGGEGAAEIVFCTGLTGDGRALSVARGQEGTAARPWPEGTRMECRLTGGMLAGLALR